MKFTTLYEVHHAAAEFRVKFSQNDKPTRKALKEPLPANSGPDRYTIPPPQHPTHASSPPCYHARGPAYPNDYVDLRRRSMARSRVASPPGASRACNLRCAGAAVGPSSEGT